MQIESEYNFSLEQNILPGLVATGLFNKTSTFLITAINGGKVLVTNLWHATNNNRDSHNILNINQSILSLTTGKFLKIAPDHDMVFIGTGSSLLVYDVENNTDVFYKEISDGVSCCCVGNLGNQTDFKDNVAVVGGNCSLAVYDEKGEEVFWSVTGDNVTSLGMVDVEGKGLLDLIVGSEDFELRVFRQDEIIHEVTETDVVTHICSMGGCLFGYGLSNGTVGVYDRLNRLWRIKSKAIPISMVAFDINGDGVMELVTGWSNGKVDARRFDTGEVIAKDNLKSSIAGVVEVTHPQSGLPLLLACSVEGEVRIYKQVVGLLAGGDSLANQDLLMDLTQKRKNLQNDIETINNISTKSQNPRGDNLTVVPTNTDVKCKMAISKDENNSGVELQFCTNNDSIIRSVLIFAEGIFEGECHVVHPPQNKLSSKLSFTIFPPRDISVSLHIKILVGYKNRNQFHVFEIIETLPKFSMYRPLSKQEHFEKPHGFVTFTYRERLQRFLLWINQNFLMEQELEIENSREPQQNEFSAKFVGIRQKISLEIFINTKSNQVTVSTENMELASQIVQSLYEYLNVTELNSSCNFPLEFDTLSEVISKIDGLQSNRQRITTDLADNSNLIKNIIVRAEDCRLMNDLNGVKKYYGDLLNLNRDVVSRFKIRSNNHQELLSLLKFVNVFIQKGGNLRAGKYRTQLIAQCRQSIKENQLYLLEKLIRSNVE